MINKLLTYLTENGITHSFFAKKIKTSPPVLSRILKKGHTPSLKLALAIETQTKGEITPYDWLPEDKNKDKPQKAKKKKTG
jgi:transcriptional regulator with XRE-family HTH domain